MALYEKPLLGKRRCCLVGPIAYGVPFEGLRLKANKGCCFGWVEVTKGLGVGLNPPIVEKGAGWENPRCFRLRTVTG